MLKAAFRLKYFPQPKKITQILMIPDPNKPNQVNSYRPTPLLPLMLKIFEVLLLSILKLTTIVDLKMSTRL